MQVLKKKIAGVLLILAPFAVLADQKHPQMQLRDPTQPLNFVAQKATQAKLELQAVFVRGDVREAVISGKRVGVGGRVNGAEVLAINEKSVVYKRDGRTRRLDLRASVIDKQ